MLRLNTTERIKFTFRDIVGFKSGLIETDFDSSSIYLYKNDGTKITIVLMLGTNFFETDPANGGGLYEFIIPNTALDQEGSLSISFQPAAGAFFQDFYQNTVSDIDENATSAATDSAAILAKTPATVIAAQNDVISARDYLAGTGYVSTNDNLHQIRNAITAPTGIANAVWNELLSLHLTPATFGEFINELASIVLNRVKIDKIAKTLTVFQADSITPLKTYALYDLNGNATAVAISERAKGI